MKLQKGLTSYAVEYDFKDAKFVYVDIYGTLMDLVKNPMAYGTYIHTPYINICMT